MNGIFISPEPVSPNSMHVVGEMEGTTFVGGVPIVIGIGAKVVVRVTVRTATGTATQTAFA